MMSENCIQHNASTPFLVEKHRVSQVWQPEGSDTSKPGLVPWFFPKTPVSKFCWAWLGFYSAFKNHLVAIPVTVQIYSVSWSIFSFSSPFLLWTAAIRSWAGRTQIPPLIRATSLEHVEFSSWHLGILGAMMAPTTVTWEDGSGCPSVSRAATNHTPGKAAHPGMTLWSRYSLETSASGELRPRAWWNLSPIRVWERGTRRAPLLSEGSLWMTFREAQKTMPKQGVNFAAESTYQWR